jgi:hypothetical protein
MMCAINCTDFFSLGAFFGGALCRARGFVVSKGFDELVHVLRDQSWSCH